MHFHSRIKSRLLVVVVTIATLMLWGITSGCDEEEIPYDFIYEMEGEDSRIKQSDDEDGDLILRVKLFFADEEAVEEDETGEYGYVKPVYRNIEFTPDIERAMRMTLEELIKGPDTEEIDEHEVREAISSEAKILSLTIDEGTVTVNFSAEIYNDVPVDALEGTIFRESLIYTITQFPTIENLLVQVEGIPWNYGQVYWYAPLDRESIGYEYE